MRQIVTLRGDYQYQIAHLLIIIMSQLIFTAYCSVVYK